MLAGTIERFIPIPEGRAGGEATLAYLAGLAREPAPRVDQLAGQLSERCGGDPSACAKLAHAYARTYILYTPDYWDGTIVEEVQTPEALLAQIAAYGNALGDCDDSAALIAAILTRLSIPVTLTAVSLHGDGLLDHVYAVAQVDGGRLPLDAAVGFPVGWEVPADEVYEKVEVPV